jgi:ribosomal protein L11 methyltransferase
VTARWVEVEVRLDPALAEGVAELVARLGQGLVEERAGKRVVYRAYLPADERTDERVARLRERLAALRAAGVPGEAQISLRPIGDQDWQEAWKAHFHTLQVAPNLVIAPSWERYQEKAGEAVVVLDPGMAFGTGQHPTTRGCLTALARLVQPGWRVVDVGTGSGILAIAAAKLGAGRVLAIDEDESALAVAADNVRRNGVARQVELRAGNLLAGVGEQAELILANIVAEAIVELAPQVLGHLAPGGRLVASGIVAAKQELVRQALGRAGLAVLEAWREGEWVTLVAGSTGEEG